MNLTKLSDVKSFEGSLPSSFGTPSQLMAAIDSFVKSAVKSELTRNVSVVVQSLIESHLKGLAENILNTPKEGLKELLNIAVDKRMNEMGNQVDVSLRVLNEKIKDVTNISSPQYYLSQNNELRDLIYQLRADFSVLNYKYTQLSDRLDSTIKEEVTSDEIKNLWEKSGVQLKELCVKFDISLPTASKWVNGGIVNPKKKNLVRNFLKTRISETKEI